MGRDTFMRAARAIGALFTAPFRVDLRQVGMLSPSERKHQRRSAFLRLILACILFLLVLVLLPAAVLGHAAVASLWRLGLVILLAAVGVILNARRHTTIAGILFTYGALAFTVDFLVTNPTGLDLQAILTMSLFSAFILIVGLILPGWLTWLSAGVMTIIAVACVFFLPFAQPLQQLSPDLIQLRVAVAGPLVVLYLLIALFSWLAGRSSDATVETVSAALEREQELGKLKDQFITSVNHELRTPLMALHGYVKLLGLRHQTLSPERRGELIEKAERAGKDLVALVTSILELQSLDEMVKAFTPEQIIVREGIDSAIRLVELEPGNPQGDSAAERDIRVDVPEGLTVWADAVRLRQILTNLLSNALKYSPSGTPIEVAARVLPAGSERARRSFSERLPGKTPMVEITIRDYGYGIPSEQIPLLFERFVRLPRDLASNVAGNGLGLYLCRTFAEAMKGRIWVESTGIEGEGTAFHLILPS
jgi:signal transduction histidine kinase